MQPIPVKALRKFQSMTWKRKLQEAMLSVVTRDDMKTIMAKQIAMARQGDIDAAKFVFENVIGKPSQRFEAESVEGSTQKTYLMLPIDTDPDAP